MKTLAIMLALAGSFGTVALADEPAGLSGTVVDVKSGQPIPHATLYYYRSPYLEKGPNHIMTLQTNDRGFFTDLTLEPGRYVIMARFPNKVQGCAVEDVMGGEVARIKVEMGHDSIMCTGPRVHPALVDPNASASVYRI
ncbi:MAG: carboxypeptidase regulatory-like domain-containing protein [Candidatus Eremiobacteraeota bacterium]|nr:carboxypeptidase regulatory-like domain-containing protein [Candidatus Eremiobacteraeota bacterium]